MKKAKTVLSAFAITLFTLAPLAAAHAYRFTGEVDLEGRQAIEQAEENQEIHISRNSFYELEEVEKARGALEQYPDSQPEIVIEGRFGRELDEDFHYAEPIREIPGGIVRPGLEFEPLDEGEVEEALAPEEEEILVAALPETESTGGAAHADKGPAAGFSGGACSLQAIAGASPASVLILGVLFS